MEKNQIYGASREHIYQKELKRLEEAKISPKNKELISKFNEFLFSKSCKDLRVAKLSSQLRRICQAIPFDLDKATKDDIQSVIVAYNRNERYAEATKADYRRCLKQFYKWHEEQDVRLNSQEEAERLKAQQFYKFVKEGIKIAHKPRQIDPDSILTKDDIDVIVRKGCRTMKEKALIKFLHETGVRAAELLNMRIKDIAFKHNSAMVTVDGKTGMRTIPIVSSIQYLVGWLEVHPIKDDRNAYLWIGENRKHPNRVLQHRGTQKLIDRCIERAGLKKQHNLHWFRHSRATLLAPKLTESLLCKYMGWTLGSEQVKTYVHLCTQQLEDAYLVLNEIKPRKEHTKEAKSCSCCGASNDSIARYCYVCGRPIDVSIAVQDQERIKNETDNTIKVLMEIAKDPKLLEAFNKFKSENSIKSNSKESAQGIKRNL